MTQHDSVSTRVCERAYVYVYRAPSAACEN